MSLLRTPHHAHFLSRFSSFGSGPELLATGDKNNFWSILTDAARCVTYFSPLHPLFLTPCSLHAQDLRAFRQLPLAWRLLAPLSPRGRALESAHLALPHSRPGAHPPRLFLARPLPFPRASSYFLPNAPLLPSAPHHSPMPSLMRAHRTTKTSQRMSLLRSSNSQMTALSP